MKRFAVILGLGLLLGIGAYAACYFLGTAHVRALSHSTAPELAWLKEEYHLSDTEFARISELHAAYQNHCAEMCQRIDARNNELKAALARADRVTPEVAQKLAEAAALRTECQQAMLKHFFAVSQTMPPEQGHRYLAWVFEQTFPQQHGMAGMNGMNGMSGMSGMHGMSSH